MKQIAHAILSAKIDLILNREVKDLTFSYNFAWANRSKILTRLVRTIIDEADIAALCQRLITIIDDATRINEDENTNPPPEINSDSWVDWAKGILESLKRLPQQFAETIIKAVRSYYMGMLSGISAVVTQISEFLRSQLESDGVLNLPDTISDTSSEIYLPLSLSLDEDKNGDFLPYLTLKNGTSHTDIWTLLEDGNYYKLEATTVSSEIGNVNNLSISTKIKLKIRFTDPGYSISSDISAIFISAGVSVPKGEFDQDIILTFNFNSIYNKANNEVSINKITHTTIDSIELERNDASNSNFLNIADSESNLEKGESMKIRAFIK